MKLTTSILAVTIMAGAAWAQNTDAIDQARSVAKSLQQKQQVESDNALAAAGMGNKPAQQAAPQKPAPATVAKAAPTPAPAKPAMKPAAAQSTKPQAVVQPVAKTQPAVKTQLVAKTATPAHKLPVKVAVATAKKPVKNQKPERIAATESKPVAKTAPASAAMKAPEVPKAAPQEEKKWAMSGKRDPFFSPVVQQQGGSGCSTGKKCLEIGHINVRGVVKSDNGFIAVVTNDMNKAYFLRENDPVFNGYVVKITGDSVVFQETVQDKLGKPFTREITKRILTPAV